MDKATLVEVDLNRSEQIVSALEAAGIRVVVAIWVHFPEYEYWRFVLASRSLDSLTLGEANSKVNGVLAEAGLSVWEIPTIFIMKTTDPFIRAIRKVFGKTEKNVVGMRLGGRTWGDRFIEDGYAYKIA
ncbi:hypothetical protein HNQ77_004304 [Silvibacterium bohemicum]|uniref:Uncharacterized protein n=1 Tax=Silvibacterium bohemicum TaxID=1577686 RepID=A0A841JYA4_9BACT|nr:hypothetical protein [Silvibacterium bohemicum]MBB6146332.1 hypothetical protein [Silvibacterium bohemicum]